MPVNFVEKKKREKYILLATAVLFLAAAVILWFGYFNNPEGVKIQVYEPVYYPEDAIVIDFKIFENQLFKELLPFISIPPYEGELGKANPFLDK